ncbi:DUF4397 domain-containing protein [Nocardioides donggukensis]|uniref:DUF4397 domain-containing protein n=1 Tax=Nocardioides donggukensis TaxID=2774019 RepID=A0A927K5V8_9ACTN|nr:DUF4397 domain-containing protein [Nocardioides donggukensis]MBD8869588.1 DUF4397 domain-containing protein [Nocardioides donggukensis]
MRFWIPALVGGAFTLAAGAVASGATGAVESAAPATPGTVTVVTAVPDSSLEVRIDGEAVAATGAVTDPVELAPGSHEVWFGADGAAPDEGVTSAFRVRSGATLDLVIHRPATVDGDPVVSSFPMPTKPIGPGKARVLLAHTATVPPADVRVNGETVFTNIANGEFATADLPGGSHRVALLPTGRTSDPILGPLDLAVEAGTVTMVYAVGNPRDGSMDVVAHTASLSADGTVAPDTIRTGSAGLAAERVVVPFGPG